MQFKCRDPKQNLELTFEHCMSSIIAVTSACLRFLYSKCSFSEKQHFERMQTELFPFPVSKHHSACVETLQKILKSGKSCYATLNKNKPFCRKKGFPIVAAHLRGMRPTPYSDKDILKPNGKLKTLNTTD